MSIIDKYNAFLKAFPAAERYKPVVFFVLKVISIYLFLYLLYLGYVGLVDPRGAQYSPFLASFSIVDLLLRGLIYPAKFILSIFGYEVFHSLDWIAIKGARGVRIAFPCLGVEMMIALFSLIVSYPANGKKILFIMIGMIGIHFINILRVVAILLTNYYSFELTSPSHTIFNTIVYIFILLYFYLWLRRFSFSSKSPV